MGNKNRNKGHNYERQLRKDFINLGFMKTGSMTALSMLDIYKNQKNFLDEKIFIEDNSSR